MISKLIQAREKIKWAILNPEMERSYLKKCRMTMSGLRIKLSSCSYVLFIAGIAINSIKILVSCYFYHNDETNIAMRKRVDLSH